MSTTVWDVSLLFHLESCYCIRSSTVEIAICPSSVAIQKRVTALSVLKRVCLTPRFSLSAALLPCVLAHRSSLLVTIF